MKFRRRPTRVQWVMVVLMGVAFAALFAWAVPEIVGIIDPAAEDTYSEVVWDLALPGLVTVVILHLTAGILFVWSAIHFVEGWVARRRKERG